MSCKLKVYACVLLLLLTCVASGYAWYSSEYVPVETPLLKRLGYSCLTGNFDMGPMKNGEKKNIPDICGVAECKNGTASYLGCLIASGFDCDIVEGDQRKPYPQCCERGHC